MKPFRIFACLGLAWLALFAWRHSVREEARATRERAAEESVAKAIPDVDYQVQIYDVSDLCTKTEPEGDIIELGGHPRVIHFSHKEYQHPTDQDLVETIRREIAPKTWDDPEHSMFSIDVSNGKLVIMHTNEVHRQIREFLEEYRSRRKGWLFH